MSVPKRIGDRIAIIPGDYVVIQSTGRGDRYLAEVTQVIDNDYEMFYRAHDLWPKEYDMGGYVERLAEKIKNAEAAAERERALRKQQKVHEKYCGGLPGSANRDCQAPIKAEEKKKKKEVKIKQNAKFEKDCLANTPLFPDDGITLDLEEDFESRPENIANCSTNTGKATNCGTNTGKLKINTGLLGKVHSDTSCGTSACCSKARCRGNSAKHTKNTATEPFCTEIVTSRDKLPPLYGKCTPWRLTKKEKKKKCREYY